ncbi:natural resistance-associated macrophage protein-domain-containing protein, partial [Gilbertella persicaria]|uniref:natural resistance-associated macrophage protein-domain-containing protein n=1 Tax=Gilbertella persicaria TaxID=101096 RepID=UPI0022207E64
MIQKVKNLDPGNWATDMEGGSSFGYRLLFIILISNIIAVFLQNLTIRLGTIAGLDLAAASRKYFHRYLNFFSYSDIVAVDVFKGYLPTKKSSLIQIFLCCIGIIGATVMPHNSRCREWRSSRLTGLNLEAMRSFLDSSLKCNLHYGFIDLVVALTFAFFVNSAILVVASANFYYGPNNQQQQVEDLSPAAIVFALALLCAGQSSTLTATLAGQVIMSGFLGMTTRPWIRRIVTRLIAIIPAMIAACVAGRSGLTLSIQLPFAVVPLVYFTAKKKAMKLDLPVSMTQQSKMSFIDHNTLSTEDKQEGTSTPPSTIKLW